MPRKNYTPWLHIASNLLTVSQFLFDIRSLFTPPAPDSLEALNRLRAENLDLKNQNEDLKKGINGNRIIEGDLKIELLKAKLARELAQNKAAGIDGPTFKAADYAEPGDMRRGILPPE